MAIFAIAGESRPTHCALTKHAISSNYTESSVTVTEDEDKKVRVLYRLSMSAANRITPAQRAEIEAQARTWYAGQVLPSAPESAQAQTPRAPKQKRDSTSVVADATDAAEVPQAQESQPS